MRIGLQPGREPFGGVSLVTIRVVAKEFQNEQAQTGRLPAGTDIRSAIIRRRSVNFASPSFGATGRIGY